MTLSNRARIENALVSMPRRRVGKGA